MCSDLMCHKYLYSIFMGSSSQFLTRFVNTYTFSIPFQLNSLIKWIFKLFSKLSELFANFMNYLQYLFSLLKIQNFNLFLNYIHIILEWHILNLAKLLLNVEYHLIWNKDPYS